MSIKRNRLKARLHQKDTYFDLVVIGGGITGAGIYREAVRAGLNTLLLDARDFSAGTSSKSSKLVHGGLRYLKEGNVLLTRSALRERERLLEEAPGLVEPLHFLISTYKGQKPGKLTFRAGLTIYDILAQHWDHKSYNRDAFLKLAPNLDPIDLEGGLRYLDAQTDDCRLVLRLIFEAEQEGGTALNYLKVNETHKLDDGTWRLELIDQLNHETTKIHTGLVVNATGAWADQFRPAEDKKIRPLRGSHVIFPRWRVPAPQAMTILHPDDRRPVFLLPWEGATVFGTTDLDHRESLEKEPHITADEVAYLLRAVNAKFPSLHLSSADIISTFAGVRPIISEGDGVDPSKASRDHEIWDDDGLLTITGGKLTTFRKMAFDLLEQANKYLPEGVEFDKKTPVFRYVRPNWPDHTPENQHLRHRLLGRIGIYIQDLLDQSEPGDLERIPGTETTWIELVWAAAHEQVETLADLMLRRVRIGMVLTHGGEAILDRILAKVAPVLAWDEQRQAEEKAAYLSTWNRHYGVPKIEDQAAP